MHTALIHPTSGFWVLGIGCRVADAIFRVHTNMHGLRVRHNSAKTNNQIELLNLVQF